MAHTITKTLNTQTMREGGGDLKEMASDFFFKNKKHTKFSALEVTTVRFSHF